MNIKPMILLGLLLALIPFGLVVADENYMFHSITATIMAGDPDTAAARLTGWAEQNGGYFILRSTGQVILRFPYDKTSVFREFLEESADVYSYSAEATDLRESILTYKSGIEAREEILERNMTLVARANFNQTLYLEQEILRLMDEIETLKGNLKKAENDRRMAYAVITINFQSQTLPQNIPSSFAWINALNFTDFITRDFNGSGGGSFYRVATPEGFALVENGLTYRAISPEGVRIRIRRGRNYPKKDIDFWAPAMVRQLKQGGYQGKGEGEFLETALGRGFVMEWGVPWGQQDYVYLTALVPRGKHIYVIEAAGDVRIFDTYRKPIKELIETFRL